MLSNFYFENLRLTVNIVAEICSIYQKIADSCIAYFLIKDATGCPFVCLSLVG